VSLFGYPFSGELTVSSRPFATDIAIFEGRFDDKPAHEQAIGSPSTPRKRGAEAPWPPEVSTAAFASPADGSEQKTLLYLPPGDEPVPLLVAFHTWSGNYLQNEAPYAEWCIARGWAFAHPDLRGPGDRPEAAGSDLAFADLRAVLELAQSRRRIDPERIYAVGVSGGGMMALLAAARMPDVWAAASAWVPVTDLAAWHADSLARKNKYGAMIERVCGGPPGAAAAVDAAYTTRSVVARLETARLPFPIDINTGIHDGHTGSVPVSHAIRAFNAVAAAADCIPATVTDALVKNRRVPADLAFADADPLYATKPVLLRRQSGPARLTVFDGGHDILHEAALTWLEAQRRGTAATWSPQPHAPPILSHPDPAAGK
jgi:dienelactone hydrolase